MARYKNYSYTQTVMLPIRFDQQILPGSFEETINHITDCWVCELRTKCLRNPKTVARQVHIFYDHKGAKDSLLEKMKKKIDLKEGRHIYSKRMGIIEPVFGNIKNNLGLNRFKLRGKKINIQWKLFAIIHNIGKIYRYRTEFA